MAIYSFKVAVVNEQAQPEVIHEGLGNSEFPLDVTGYEGQTPIFLSLVSELPIKLEIISIPKKVVFVSSSNVFVTHSSQFQEATGDTDTVVQVPSGIFYTLWDSTVHQADCEFYDTMYDFMLSEANWDHFMRFVDPEYANVVTIKPYLLWVCHFHRDVPQLEGVYHRLMFKCIDGNPARLNRPLRHDEEVLVTQELIDAGLIDSFGEAYTDLVPGDLIGN